LPIKVYTNSLSWCKATTYIANRYRQV